MDFSFDGREFLEKRNELYNFARKGVPHAARDALNKAAFAARREWLDQTRQHMTLRNTWTTRSIRVEKARGTDMRRLESKVGSAAPYMAVQEDGGTERKKHKHGVPIPTPIASGEGRGARPRKRVVRRPNQLPSIHLGARGRGNRRQRNAVAIRTAIASGKKFVFLELEKTKGIFKIAGGKRRPRLDMVWNISRASVRTPPTRTLARTMHEVRPMLPRIHIEAIVEQLKRHRVIRI